jgi:hypothetical protein
MYFAILADIEFKKNKKAGIIFLILSLLVVCFIAGVRNTSIGTDTNGYVANIFNLYSHAKYNFFEVQEKTGIEPLFSMLMLISSFSNDIKVCLFFIELACALPIYLFAYREKKKYSFAFIIFIFLTTMYAKSFNLIRQSIAISIVIYSVSFFKSGQYKQTILLYITAILFHYSAIICCLIYFILYVTNNLENNKSRILLLFIMFVFLVGISIGIDKILMLIPNKYTYYLNSKYAINSISLLSIVKKAFWIFLFIFPVIQNKKNKKNYSNELSYCILLIVDFILYLTSMKVGTFGRIGNYFLYVAYFYMIPNISKVFKQKNLINLIIVVSLCFFWYNMTVQNFESDKLYPYISDEFEILND